MLNVYTYATAFHCRCGGCIKEDSNYIIITKITKEEMLEKLRNLEKLDPNKLIIDDGVFIETSDEYFDITMTEKDVIYDLEELWEER